MKKKKMMSGIKTTKQTVMETEQTVMEMMTNLGKMVELMGVVKRIVVMKKKQMMSRIKKTKQTVKEMMDAVMEIMAVMIIMTKNQRKKVDMRRNQDLLLTILLNQKKTPTLLGFIRQLPKDFQAITLQKQMKTKTRKRKRTSVQYNKSDVITNCVKTYQKKLNHQILGQKLYFNDGIKTSQQIVLLQKNN